MYTPKEMKTIVYNCNTIDELMQTVAIFKQLFNENLINTYYKLSLILIINSKIGFYIKNSICEAIYFAFTAIIFRK